MHDDQGTGAGRKHAFGQPDGNAGAQTVQGTDAVLRGSVSGHLSVPGGTTLTVDGVLEEAMLVGHGTVNVAGMLAEVYSSTTVTLNASPGSVIAPVRSDGFWYFLRDDGTWARSPQAMFPRACADGPWFPVPEILAT